MRLEKFIEVLDAEYASGPFEPDENFEFAFASDLMSDVLALVDNTTVLVTGLNNPQALRTAEMLDISLVILVRGKKPSLETIEIANENNITIITTKYIMFEACGKLYEAGLLPFPIC